MKKISILICALALAGGISAQNRQLVGDFNERATKMATEAELQASRQGGEAELARVHHARGTEFFCETFSNGLDGENGAWTIDDSSPGNTIWQMANASSPAGEFSTNISALGSPTAANGWVIFDCDLYNTPISDGTVEDVTGWLISPELDMSSLSSVIVEYYHYFRYCCFPGSPLTLEVSTDGGTSWIVFPAHGSFVQSANTLSANPLYTTVDVSCVAAGEESVILRWGFNSAVEAGYSHYFWGIDDVCIYENPAVDDLQVLQVMNGDIFNIWEYRITPLEQAPISGDGGLLVGAIYRNAGSANQTGVTITFDILDSDGTTVLGTFTSDSFDVTSAPNALECPNALQDTLYLATGWVPSSTGDYFIRATIEGDQTDETSEDNTMVKDIVYSDDIYGHDNEALLDLEILPGENDDNYNQTGYGCFYTFPNAGSMAFGLVTQLGEGSDENTEFVAAVYQFTDDLDNSEYITGETYLVQDEWIGGDPEYLPFDGEEEMLTGEVYFACIQTEGETDGALTVLAQSDSDNDNSTLINEIGGDNLNHWFTSQTWTPIVRLILANTIGIEGEIEAGLENFEVNPNPAVDNAVVKFTLNTNKVIAYEVRDMNGRLVTFDNIGRFAAGQHQFDLNVSNYAGGQYTVSLVVGGEKLFSRKLMVERN